MNWITTVCKFTFHNAARQIFHNFNIFIRNRSFLTLRDFNSSIMGATKRPTSENRNFYISHVKARACATLRFVFSELFTHLSLCQKDSWGLLLILFWHHIFYSIFQRLCDILNYWTHCIRDSTLILLMAHWIFLNNLHLIYFI